MNETTSGIFKSAHEALTFAYRFDSQQYGRSAMAIALANHAPSGRGLGGLDGAGQAGMIRRMVRNQGELYEALARARYLPRTLHCSCDAPCCSGMRPNLAWNAAIRTIGQMSIAATPGCVSILGLRCGIVARYFGNKDIDLGRLADHCDVHRNTATKHNGLIVTWLRGQPGKGSERAKPGMEAQAMQAIAEALEAAGLLIVER
ncbi:DNA-binding protein [Pigmentiphaga sp. YJ18]|uniref:DNA-binding protein n=1 Tax=Pigmentiphaga sp. YJ18 TaxID=3134907 RepID=UPI00311486D7